MPDTRNVSPPKRRNRWQPSPRPTRMDPSGPAVGEAAFADAANLDELKAALRLAHTAEKSPLSQANPAIRNLPKEQATAGKSRRGHRGPREPGACRPDRRVAGRGRGADPSRKPSTPCCPRRRRAGGTRSPPCRNGATFSSAWAGRSPRAPRSSRSGSTSTRSTSEGPPRAADAGHLLRRPGRGGLVLRTQTSPVQVRPCSSGTADLRPVAGQGVPHRRPRRHTHSRSHPTRSSAGRPWRPGCQISSSAEGSVNGK